MSKSQKTSSSNNRSNRREPEPEVIVTSKRNTSSSSAVEPDRRSGRKRTVDDIEPVRQNNSSSSSNRRNDDEEEVNIDADDVVVTNYHPKLFPLRGTATDKDNKRYEKDREKFNTLSGDAQAQCIKAVSRYLILRGGKKETLTRTGVSDVLTKIDPEYKKHLTVILNKAQARLNHYLGLAVVSSDAILGYKFKDKEKRQDDYFLTNNLHSDKLQQILSKANQSSAAAAAWFGFMCVIFFNIYTSAGKRAAVEDLLVSVRKVDKRFPATLNVKKRDGDESLPVPELEEDFLGLLARMKKEHYIIVYKNENAAADKGDVNDPGKVIYTLGPRYFLDIGHKKLMEKYYAFMHPNCDADKAVMKEIEEERQLELQEQDNEAEAEA